MYIYDETIDEVFYSSKFFDYYYKDSNQPGEENTKIGVFDIETTGLSPANGQIIMGGILTKTDGGLRVRQFFTEDEGEEEELLLLYKEALDEMDVLVSYNGNGFDFPFLKYRLKRYHLDSSFFGILSLDMFGVLNKHSNFRDIIPNLKQKTVEEYLGLRDCRDDVIDGGQSVELFYRYMIEKSHELRDVMLLHNRDDVLQLARILWAFDKLDIHKIAAYTGFPVKLNGLRIIVTRIKVKTKRLEVNGKIVGITERHHIYRQDCTVIVEPEQTISPIGNETVNGEISITIPLRYEEKVSFLKEEDLEFRYDSNGYILMKENGVPDYRIIDPFIKCLLRDILSKI